MVAEPEECTSWTESTLSIVWADVCQLWRLVYDSRRHPEGISKGLDVMTEAEKLEFIKKSTDKFDEKYIKICSPLIPIQWVSSRGWPFPNISGLIIVTGDGNFGSLVNS